MGIRLSSRAAALLAVIAAVGCSTSSNEPSAVVKGKLVDGDKPYTFASRKVKGVAPVVPPGGVASGTALQIVFSPVDGGDLFFADLNGETGTFEVKGHDGKGIKPGKYKIHIELPNALPGVSDAPEVFGGKFNRDRSKIERDVAIDGPDIVIDVSKSAG